jgi:hypothetical protein
MRTKMHEDAKALFIYSVTRTLRGTFGFVVLRSPCNLVCDGCVNSRSFFSDLDSAWLLGVIRWSGILNSECDSECWLHSIRWKIISPKIRPLPFFAFELMFL